MIFFKTIKIVLFISFHISFLFCESDIDNAIKYSLKLDREIIYPGEVVTLVADINLSGDYYIYSSNPEKALSPSYIEWIDSSYFDAVSILNAPKPKFKYDPNFKMEKHLLRDTSRLSPLDLDPAPRGRGAVGRLYHFRYFRQVCEKESAISDTFESK